MFSNYLYLSSTSKTFRSHFESAAKKYVKEFKLSPSKSYIIDVGSNDGVALKPFKNLKIRVKYDLHTRSKAFLYNKNIKFKFK